MKHTWLQYAVLLLALATMAVAQAEDEADSESARHSYLQRKHVLMAGAYWQEAEAEIRETRDPLPRIALNLGHLGVDETDTTWYLEYRYRFAERWSVVLSGQRFSGSGEVGLTRDLNFAGLVFPAGVSLETKLEVDTYFADVMYKAYSSPTAEIAIGGGLHIFDFDATLYGRSTIENRLVNRSRELISSNSDMIAPLPNVRSHAFYAINDRLALMGNVGWMSANVDEWDGSFGYLHLRTHLMIGQHLGVALGYQFTDVDVSRDRGRQSSEYDIEFSGPSLMLTLGW